MAESHKFFRPNVHL